jgi:TonB family protein
MKINICLLVAVSCLILHSRCFAANDVLWTGFKYAVGVVYIGIDEEHATLPFPKSVQLPEYPIEAMKAAASGDILLSFLVSDDGSVSVTKISGDRVSVFGGAARHAVSKWTFFPARMLKESAKTVPVHMTCRLEFRATERVQ